MVAQDNLCGYLTGIHVGREANYVCVLGTLSMSVFSTLICFRFVTNPKQGQSIWSFSDTHIIVLV